jgi:hypothetical protein
MDTFSTARGTPPRQTSVPGSLLQHAAGPQIHRIDCTPGISPAAARDEGRANPSQQATYQCVERRLRPYQAKARPPRPTSSTPAKMVSSPGSPKPGPSPPEAAAWVGVADLVTGLFQFESVDGLVDGVALVAAAADGVS